MKPQIILAGGGEPEDELPLNRLFAKCTGTASRILYLPIAMDGVRVPYATCREWFSSVFRPLGIHHFEMWTDIFAEDHARLNEFTAIFIGGGNTYRLLKLLRDSGFDQALMRFVAQGGIIEGGSAGAIILGRDINTCAHMDANEVDLQETRGLNLIADHAIWCHYREDDDQRIAAYIATAGFPVIALTERSGVQIADDHLFAAGYEGIIRFTASSKDYIRVGNELRAD